MILSARDIHKQFRTAEGPLEVLKGISLDVKEGEFLAIQGASGSGKSTLLSVLAGLDRPTRGTLSLDGVALETLPERELAKVRRDKVGFVFQAFHLVPSLTVAENVALPSAFQAGSFSEDRARALLDRLGLTPRRRFFPDQLSGGEKQRAALARALLNTPKIIFADEPTGNLDSVNGRLVLDLLEENTRRAGRALVLVTHDDAIAARADRRVRIVDGRLAVQP